MSIVETIALFAFLLSLATISIVVIRQGANKLPSLADRFKLIDAVGRIQIAREELQYAKAELLADEALKSLQHQSFDSTASPAFMTLGMSAAITKSELGKFDEALSLVDKYLLPYWQRYRVAGREEGKFLAVEVNNLGCIFDDLNRPQEALSCYLEAVEIKHHSKIFDLRIQEANIGFAQLCLNRLDEAERILRKVLVGVNVAKGNKLVATVCAHLGEVAIEQENWVEAADLIGVAYKRKQELYVKNHPDLARITVSAARILEHKNEDVKAREHFDKALAICKQSVAENHAETLMVVNQYSLFLERSGSPDYEKERQRANEIRSVLEAVHLPPGVSAMVSQHFS